MSDPLDKLAPPQLVWAYVDGELDPVREAEVFRRLAADPAAAEAVRQQVRLREAVARAMADVPSGGDDLARKVSALAFQMPPAVSAAGGRRRPTIGTRVPAAAAAGIGLLAVGLLAGRYAVPPAAPPQVAGSGTRAGADPVPVGLVTAATVVHVRCSRAIDHHAGDGWPAELASLEEPVRRYVGGEHPYPDLSDIGFRFAGCGPCGRPTEQGVHVLYRSAGGTDTISLFVERDRGQLPIAPGTCHDCTTADGAHPVLAWRAQGLVFFLVGNAPEPVDRARKAMNLPAPV